MNWITIAQLFVSLFMCQDSGLYLHLNYKLASNSLNSLTGAIYLPCSYKQDSTVVILDYNELVNNGSVCLKINEKCLN